MPSSWCKYMKEFDIYRIIITRQWENKYRNNKDYIQKSESDKTIVQKTNFGTIISSPYKPNFANRLLLKYGEKKYKIKYECSVAPNMKSNSKLQKYDFTKYINKEPYFFKLDPITKTQLGKFIECPINYYEINFFDKLFGKITAINKTTSIFGNGKGRSPIKKKNLYYICFTLISIFSH